MILLVLSIVLLALSAANMNLVNKLSQDMFIADDVSRQKLEKDSVIARSVVRVIVSVFLLISILIANPNPIQTRQQNIYGYIVVFFMVNILFAGLNLYKLDKIPDTVSQKKHIKNLAIAGLVFSIVGTIYASYVFYKIL